MKKVFVLSLLGLVSSGVMAQSKPAAKPRPVVKKPATAVAKPLKTAADSLSYAFGISLGEFLKSQGVSSISFPLLNQAITQTLKGQKTLIDVNQSNQVIGRIAEEKREKVSGAEKAIGTKFLAENKKRTGVFTTASDCSTKFLLKELVPYPLFLTLLVRTIAVLC